MDDLSPALLGLVEDAAAVAAQRVAAIHRRRLVFHTFLAALVAACIVTLPIVLIANHQRAVAATQNARYNCTQWRAAALVLRDFINSDARLRQRQQHYAQRAQVIVAFEKILTPKLLRDLTARSQRLDSQAQAYWHRQLVPRLEALADVNCHALLTTGGPVG
jgi:tRNA nucleotidyltransferase/poly(A) polymerase